MGGTNRSPPRLLLAVPNVTAHPSKASVTISVLCICVLRIIIDIIDIIIINITDRCVLILLYKLRFVSF